MTTLKSLLLMTGFIFSIQSFAQGIQCIPSEQFVAPAVPDRTMLNAEGVTVDTPAWITWKSQVGSEAQVEARKNLACCPTLEMNPTTRECLDKTLIDPTLIKCESNATCTDGKGCFPRREDDMFKLDSNSTDEEINQKTALLEIFEQQQDEVDEPKPNGGLCQRHMDCESLNCKRAEGSFFAVCVPPPTICRFADVDEVAVGAIKCDEKLEKHTGTNKCYDPSVSTFKGPLGQINVIPTDAQRCQYTLVPTAPDALPTDLQPAIKNAIGTTRGMEWLFATSTHQGDCQKVIDFLRAKVLEQLNTRKEILRDYNLNIKAIEENFAIISAAQKDVMEPMITTLCGDTTTPHDIAMRRATGVDYLCYMRERNKVFMVYEADMLVWTNEVNKIIDNYQANVFSWDDNSKGDWNIGENSYSWKNPKCRYYINLLLGVITPKKKKKRWHQKYHASSHQAMNAIIDSANVTKYLKFIGDDNTAREMKRGYFLDPIMPGGSGMGFSNFGNGQGMFQQGAVGVALSVISPTYLVANLISGIGNGPEYNRNLRNGEMATMYNRYEARLVEYMKGLKMEGVAVEDFIVEPEMPGSYENRGCLNDINAEKCKKFKAYVADVRDNAFAQFLTYSKHHKSKYKHYYRSEGTFRKKLWNRYTTDLVNLQNYYKAVAQLRSIQNECIDKVINQIRGGDFSGEGMGITQGTGNYFVEGENNYQTGNAPTLVKAPNIKTSQTTTPYQISLSVYNKAMKTGGLKDSVTTGSGAGLAKMSEAAAANLAARNKTISDTNAKAKAAGKDLAKEEAEMRASMSDGKSAAAGAASSAGSSSNSSMGSGSAGNKATLDAEGGAKTSASGATGIGASGAGVGSAPAAGGLTGIAAGIGSGATASPVSAKEDASGMSDEEKDAMKANYDRTKTKYETKDEDSLFQVVSKTYVRNLDKILTRKKKLDEDAASAPSTPSTP